MRLWIRPIDGSFGILGSGIWLHIKAPWNKTMLFSERHGWVKPKKIWGFRIYYRRILLG